MYFNILGMCASLHTPTPPMPPATQSDPAAATLTSEPVWHADPESLGMEGRAVLEGLEYSDPSLREPIRGISGTARLDGDRVEITSFAASLGRSLLEGRCTLQGFDEPRIRFTLNAPMLDLDELLAITASTGTEQANVGSRPVLQVASMGEWRGNPVRTSAAC